MGVGGAEEWRSTVESSINVTMEIVDCGSPKIIHPGMCIIFERDDLTSQMTFSAQKFILQVEYELVCIQDVLYYRS